MPEIRPKMRRSTTAPLTRPPARTLTTTSVPERKQPVDDVDVGTRRAATREGRLPTPIDAPGVAALTTGLPAGAAASLAALQEAKAHSAAPQTTSMGHVPQDVPPFLHEGRLYEAPDVLAKMLAGTWPLGWYPRDAWRTLGAWIERALPALDDGDRAAVAQLLKPLREARVTDSPDGTTPGRTEARNLAARLHSSAVHRVVHPVGQQGHCALLEVEKTGGGLATLRYHDSQGVDDVTSRRGGLHSAATGPNAIGRKAHHTVVMSGVELAKLSETKLQALLALRAGGAHAQIQAWFDELGTFELPSDLPLRAVQKIESCTVDAPMSYFASGLGHERFERLKSALVRVLLRDGKLTDDDGTPARLERQVQALDGKGETRSALRAQRDALPADLKVHDFGALATEDMDDALRAQGAPFGIYEPVAMSSALALAHADGTHQVVVLDRDDDGEATGGVRLMQLEGGAPSMQSRFPGSAPDPVWPRTIPGKRYANLEALLTALATGEDTVLRGVPRHAFTDELLALQDARPTASELVAQFAGRALGDPFATTLDDLAPLAAVLARLDEPCPPLDAFFATFAARAERSPTAGTWTPSLASDVLRVLARPSTRHANAAHLVARAMGSLEKEDANRLVLDALADPRLDLAAGIVDIFRSVVDEKLIDRAKADLSERGISFEALLDKGTGEGDGMRHVLWSIARNDTYAPAARKAALVAASSTLPSVDEAVQDLARVIEAAPDARAMMSHVATSQGWPDDFLAAAIGPREGDPEDARWYFRRVLASASQPKEVEEAIDAWRADLARA